MELELERDHLHHYETILDTTLCQEETMESIVPDACPDIQRIVDCCGQAYLTGKQVQDRMATINGIIRVAILYQPEGDKNLRRLELSLPFTCQAESKELTEAGIVLASPRLRWLESRMLNPRKVLLRVDLAVDVRLCQSREEMICGSVVAPEGSGICQLTDQRELFQLSAVQERPFMFSEEVRLPGSGGGNTQILLCRGTAVCTESKLIGTKLIFKGNVNVQMLTQDGSGMLSTQQEALAFSQVMEVPGVGENGDCEMAVELTDLNYQFAGEDRKSLEISMELLAQAQVWTKRPAVLLQDLYSTSLNTEVQTGMLSVAQLLDHAVRTQSVRELVETSVPVHSVVDSWISLGETVQKQEGEQSVITAQCKMTVLYSDEDGQMQSVQRSVSVSCRLDCPEGAICSCRCVHSGEVFAALASGGVEVRFNLEFHCMALTSQKVPVVTMARTGEERTKSGNDQPSVVMRLAAPGETLWEIAKAYGTTQEEIIQANDLEGEQPPCNTMLLIPRIR